MERHRRKPESGDRHRLDLSLGECVRALVRPALTLGLGGFLCTAFFAMSPGDIDRAYVADSLVFAAVTAIVWWFGDRAPKKGAR